MGEPYPYRCPLAGAGTDLDPARMRLHDAIRLGQTESGALPDWFGGKEGLDDVRQVLVVDAAPGI